ncbi:MAG: VWA domain-containing protein [Natronospirillum sp.]
MWWEQLTLLRPAWLLTLPLVGWLIWQQGQQSTLQWQRHISPDLLRPLVQVQRNRLSCWLNHLSRLGLWLLPLALAGPALERPTTEALTERPLVFILDQSLSMLSVDLPPNRHTRARQKMQDILQAHPERPAGLVAYSGTAHLVSPLTFDHHALNSLLQQLNPILMPIPGSDPVQAMQLGLAQLNDLAGDLLWLTDDLQPEQRLLFPDFSHPGQHLGILALGTPEGAPVQLQENDYLRDLHSDLVIPGLNVEQLAALGQHNKVRWALLSTDDTDWRRVLVPRSSAVTAAPDEGLTVTTDLGYGLLILALPGLLMWFRWGQLGTMAAIGLSATWLTLGVVQPVQAQSTAVQASQSNPVWADWFRSPDQQGRARLPDNPDAALSLFHSREWQGYAALEAERYSAAIALLAGAEHPRELYHRGNALVHLERYEEAIADYEAALTRDPDFAEAAENLALVEEFLRQPPAEADPQNEESTDGGLPGSGEPQQRDHPTRADDSRNSGGNGLNLDNGPRRLEDSIRRRMPEPDATFLQRKFQYQYDANPERYDPTGPPW